MQKITKLFSDSIGEMRKVRSMATAAMLLAISVILGFFAVQLIPSIKISFAFVADEIVAMLFGPFVGMVEGGLSDLVRYVVRPTGPFFPGFTISGFVSGLIYGLILYKRPLSLKRVILANSLVTLFVNMMMNTYWLTLLYGKGFMAILPARIVKELIILPIDIALFFFLSLMLSKARLIHPSKA